MDITHFPTRKQVSIPFGPPDVCECDSYLHVVTSSTRRFLFGENCFQEKFIKVNQPLERQVIARMVKPLSRYVDHYTNEHGVRFEYTTKEEKVHIGTISASAWGNNKSIQQTIERLQEQGVQIPPETKGLLIIALGYWYDLSHESDSITLFSKVGWLTSFFDYANGSNCVSVECDPPEYFEPKPENVAIQKRSGRKGSFDEWRSKAGELLSTPGVLTALGVSLAGPLVELLDLVPFGIHFAGNSTSGKTTLARFASSLWGNPNSIMCSWDSTGKALEALTETSNGACLVLDEIKRFREDAKGLSGAIHNLCSGSSGGRARLRKDGSLIPLRSWSNTILSTGENSIRDLLGEHYQGGHRVRMIDLQVSKHDELTLNAAHSEKLNELSFSQYGCVSDEWIQYIVCEEKESILEKVDDWSSRCESLLDSSPETQRIARNIGVICASLEIAWDEHLVPIDRLEIDEMLVWICKSMNLHTPKTPNERTLELLYNTLETDPSRFPWEEEASKARKVIGYKKRDKDNEGFSIWLTSNTVGSICKRAGVSPRSWVEWLVVSGYATKATRKRCASMQKWWTILPSEARKEQIV